MRTLTRVTFVLTLLLVAVQAMFAVRGMLDPLAGAAGFGYPAEGATAAFYHAVYRDRNLVIALIGLAFLLLRMWGALAIVFVASTTLPAYDIYALMHAGIPVLPLHYITLVVLLLLSGLTIACARLTRT